MNLSQSHRQKRIKIGIWNANGLQLHKHETEVLIKKNDLDILLISETHFNEYSYFKLNGYACYDTQHPSGASRGGTAIIIHKAIKHFEIEELATNEIQATSVVIEDAYGPLTISAVYCPPNQRASQDAFEKYFGMLGHRWIAGGDWNSKHHAWGSRLITPRGKILYQIIEAKKYTILAPTEPTHWPSDPNKLPDVLDFWWPRV